MKKIYFSIILLTTTPNSSVLSTPYTPPTAGPASIALAHLHALGKEKCKYLASLNSSDSKFLATGFTGDIVTGLYLLEKSIAKRRISSFILLVPIGVYSSWTGFAGLKKIRSSQ